MIDKHYQVVVPAYGRDYATPDAARTAFLSGVDFKLLSVVYGWTYCSVRDFAPGTVVNVRYDGHTKVLPVTVERTDGL